MAKKINVDEIDESFIIASVRRDRTMAKDINPPPLAPLPAVVAPQMEEAPEEDIPVPVPEELQKEESRRKRGKQDYEALFIRDSNLTARLGKTVYIRKEFHDRILKIIQVVGENEVSLFSYIDNIITHHFETFREDIIRIYNRKNNSNIF